MSAIEACLAIIPARGGSKRIPKKNLRPMGGKPLLAYTVEAALLSSVFHRVVVTTDSPDIAEIARQYGAETPFLRDPSLSDDFVPVSAATVDALQRLDPEGAAFGYVCQLMPNCPLRTAEDIVDSHRQLIATGAESQLSVVRYGWQNPWWALRRDKNLALDPIFGEAITKRSQDLPELFCPTGAIWWAKADALRREGTYHIAGRTGWELRWTRGIDIDTEDDWAMAEVLLKHGPAPRVARAEHGTSHHEPCSLHDHLSVASKRSYLTGIGRCESRQTRISSSGSGSMRLDIEAAMEAMGGDGEATWVPGERGDTPAQIRQRAFAQICEACDAVVLVDSDDVMHPTRVGSARTMLGASDLVGCALRLVDEDGQDMGVNLALPPHAEPDDLLPRHNVFGLSNSAIRSDLLAQCLPIPAEVTLVDWFLVTRAWLLGAELAFDNEVRMDYRQHGSNMSRILPPFDEAQVARDTERIRRHLRLAQTLPPEGAFVDRLAEVARVAADVECFPSGGCIEGGTARTIRSSRQCVGNGTSVGFVCRQSAAASHVDIRGGDSVRTVNLGNAIVGDGHPPYIIAEIGSNHNGDMDLCRRLIERGRRCRRPRGQVPVME